AGSRCRRGRASRPRPARLPPTTLTIQLRVRRRARIQPRTRRPPRPGPGARPRPPASRDVRPYPARPERRPAVTGEAVARARDVADALRRVQARLRDHVVSAMATVDAHELRAADDSLDGDTIYAIDRVSESLLLGLLERELADWLPLVVVAEGLPDIGHGPGVALLPVDAPLAAARHRVIVDPIDGTRGLMYGKRSAWILTGFAAQPPDRVPTLADVVVAVQTEIPPPKQLLADTLWAVRGQGVQATRTNLVTGLVAP